MPFNIDLMHSAGIDPNRTFQLHIFIVPPESRNCLQRNKNDKFPDFSGKYLPAQFQLHFYLLNFL